MPCYFYLDSVFFNDTFCFILESVWSYCGFLYLLQLLIIVLLIGETLVLLFLLSFSCLSFSNLYTSIENSFSSSSLAFYLKLYFTCCELWFNASSIRSLIAGNSIFLHPPPVLTAVMLIFFELEFMVLVLRLVNGLFDLFCFLEVFENDYGPLSILVLIVEFALWTE